MPNHKRLTTDLQIRALKPPSVRIEHPIGGALYLIHTPSGRKSWAFRYQSLNPGQRAVLHEVMRRFNGINNGRIGLSVREAAAAVHLNKDTAGAAFKVLLSRGLLEQGQAGAYSFKIRHSAEWRLTWAACNRTGSSASHAYRRYKADSGPNKGDGPVP